MIGDETLKKDWKQLCKKLSEQFQDGDPIEIDAVIYLVGIQELGRLHTKFKKHDKLDLMHIAVCCLLEPYGYYQFDKYDDQGWPHYILKESLPVLKPGEQQLLMKEALVHYFRQNDYI